MNMFEADKTNKPPHETFPRSPGVLIENALKELNLSQAALAERIGARKQHVNAWIRGREPVSEERLKRIALATGNSPDAFIHEARRYAAWLASPVGQQTASENRREKLLQSLSIKGPHFLSKSEIEDCFDAMLISVERPAGAKILFELGSSDLIECHSDLTPSGAEPPAKLIVEPGGSVQISTQERFSLPTGFRLHFNGVHFECRALGLRADMDFFPICSEKDAPINVILDNRSKNEATIEDGDPLITVGLYFNPFYDLD